MLDRALLPPLKASPRDNILASQGPALDEAILPTTTMYARAMITILKADENLVLVQDTTCIIWMDLTQADLTQAFSIPLCL